MTSTRLHVDAPATPSTALQHAAVAHDSHGQLGSAVLMIPTGNAPMNTPGTPSPTSDVSMDISSEMASIGSTEEIPTIDYIGTTDDINIGIIEINGSHPGALAQDGD
jgi:hypothetical protein